MRYIFSMVFLFIIASFMLELDKAEARCPASDVKCNSGNYEAKIKARIAQGQKDVSNASGVRAKVKAVGKTIDDCTSCAAQVFTGTATKTKSK